jgi:hypothetical protein
LKERDDREKEGKVEIKIMKGKEIDILDGRRRG